MASLLDADPRRNTPTLRISRPNADLPLEEAIAEAINGVVVGTDRELRALLEATLAGATRELTEDIEFNCDPWTHTAAYATAMRAGAARVSRIANLLADNLDPGSRQGLLPDEAEPETSALQIASPEALERSHRDEREDLAHAVVATKRLRACSMLPGHVHEAAAAFAELLEHYAPERSLRAASQS